MTKNIITVLGVIAAIVIWAMVSGVTIGERPARTETSSLKEWSVAGLSIQHPWKFGDAVNLSHAIPPERRADMLSLKAYPSDENRYPKTNIFVSRYRPGFEINMDVAVENAVHQFASASGDHAEGFRSSSISVSALPSRRISYQAKHEGESVYVEALFIKGDGVLWQVNSVHLGGDEKKLADKALDSVRVE